jgi:hypothetical protein
VIAMQTLRNERGAVLLYVLLAITILMVFTPVILNMSSTSRMNDTRSENKKKASELAVSGMESFFTYLREKPTATTYETTFEGYPGWGTYSIMMPEGTKVDYKFGIIDPTDPALAFQTNITSSSIVAGKTYDVKMVVAVGNGNLTGDKTLTYRLTVPAGAGSGHAVTSGTVSSTTSSLLNSSTAPTSTSVITTAYPNYQSDFNSLVPSSTGFNVVYSTSTNTCTDWQYNLAALNLNSIALSNGYDTVTIKVDCGSSVSMDRNITLSARNVVLFINGALNIANNNNADLILGSSTTNGMLLVNGDLSVDNKGTVIASNIFVTGTATYKETGNANVTVTGTFGAGTGVGNSHNPSITPDNTNTYTYLNSLPSNPTSPWQPAINQ